ncbi:MAG: AAA family ATPase, partial [Deltaproteobacteria bacterium]|nr:AAA family ATPase [Deltaproteobacteria bacterium]
MSRILAIANQKGGCGKTTIAVNLAATLAQRNQHVLLIDLDPQANASSGLGVDSELLETSMYDLLVDTRAAPGAITDIVRQVTPTLDLAPATVALCAVEQLLAGQDERELCLKKHLESVAHLYDYIIIDCPPSLGLL